MARYSVGGRSADTAATADHVAGLLWNPHASIALEVVEVAVFLVGATVTNGQLIRTSTAGATPGTTITPDIDNHYNREFAPISGALLYLAAFGTQPTVQGPALRRFNMPAAAGSGYIWDFRDKPIIVPAGTGLAIATPTAVVFQDSDFYFTWDE